MERVDGKGLQGRIYGSEKEKKKLKDMKEEINGHSLIQTRTWWAGIDEKRETEQYLSGYMEYQLSQDLYHS